MKVFLGGTWNESTWRNTLIPMLKCDYFNPVVENWTPEYQDEEIRQRNECDFVLYVITPKMTGVYSIAEIIDDSNKRPDKTIFCVIETESTHDINLSLIFSGPNLKSLYMVKRMARENGVTICESLEEIADFLNGKMENHA